jgi:hypothetical protein
LQFPGRSFKTDICVSDCNTVNRVEPGPDGEHVKDAEALS